MSVARLAVAAATIAACAGAQAHATPPGRDGKIAFQRFLFQDDPLQADIWLANADGSGERRVTRAPRGFVDGEPDWSPDGKQIVFQRGPSVDGPWTLWTVNADGSGARRLTPRRGRCRYESSPAFSPDGSRIAFECLRPTRKAELLSIVVVNANGSNRRVVARGRGAMDIGRPQFSPDGEHLVFEGHNVAVKPKNGAATYVVDVDGSGLRRVTPWSLGAGDHPDWSPDGKLILVRSNANGPDFYGQGSLFALRPDGGGLRRLTHFGRRVRVLQNGSFSPDGKAVVFATSEGAVRSRLPDVFSIRLDGAGLTNVTHAKNWDGSPDWGPSAR